MKTRSKHTGWQLMALFLLISLVGLSTIATYPYVPGNAVTLDFVSDDTQAENTNNGVVFIDMTCVPAPPFTGEPPIGPSPPCPIPTGIDSKFISPNPSGTAKIKVNNNGTTTVDIALSGLAPNLVITATMSMFFPGQPAPDPIFEGAPVAALSVPLAPTTAGYTEGMGHEPNQFTVKSNGKANLKVTLDYDLSQGGQAPLRNGFSTTNQVGAEGTDAEQFPCCATNPVGINIQAIGGSLLRAYEASTGFQVLDSNGLPEVLRSPVPPVFIAVLVHIDETTHGISSGVPIFPTPTANATDGDHFALGIFDIRVLQTGSISQAPQGDVVLDVPSETDLSSAYPNPFNPTTQVTLNVVETQQVRVQVFDLLGRRVALLHEGLLQANEQHRFTFDAGRLASGKYLIQATGETFTRSKSITLMK